MSVLPLHQPDPDGKHRLHASVLAWRQINEALTYSDHDFTGCPRWRFNALHDLCGQMLPGDLIVLGALTGNGKSAFALSQADAMAESGVEVLYVPLEIDPFQARRQWAAWRCGLSWEVVARNGWADLPYGSYAAFEAAMKAQHKSSVHFPPDRRITVADLDKWVRWGVEMRGITCVMVDHFHRMNHRGSGDYRQNATDTARDLKDMARQHQVSLICAAQLNRNGANALDRYIAPRLERLKETSGLAEEADVVLMLSRALKGDIDAAAMKLVHLGLKSERDFEEPNVMLVTCRKHRLRDSARDRTVKLAVDCGRVTDCLG